jgi:uncharacterized protein (TIGR02722 family)
MNLGKTNLMLYLISVLCLALGCTATVQEVSPNENLHYDESYDASDKNAIVRRLVDPLRTRSFPISGAGEKPVMIVYGIANRTDEHISTSGIADDIQMELVRSGQFSMVNKSQRDNIMRELDYQYGSGNVDESAMVERARQIGADYMMTGTLRSIEKTEPRQVRLRKRTLKYYSLNLEITDIKTGLIEWADQVEVMRESAKPFIGW